MGVAPATDALVVLALTVAAASVLMRDRRARCGWLLAAAGAAWLAGDGVTALIALHRGPLVHAAVAHPDGRVRSRAAWLVVALGYVTGALTRARRKRAPSLLVGVGAVAAVPAGARIAIRASRCGARRQRRPDARHAAADLRDTAAAATRRRWRGARSRSPSARTSGGCVRATAVGLVIDLGDLPERARCARGSRARSAIRASCSGSRRRTGTWTRPAGPST